MAVVSITNEGVEIAHLSKENQKKFDDNDILLFNSGDLIVDWYEAVRCIQQELIQNEYGMSIDKSVTTSENHKFLYLLSNGDMQEEEVPGGMGVIVPKEFTGNFKDYCDEVGRREKALEK